MKRPEFTTEQENWLCEVIGDWYLTWKTRMTTDRSPHRLGFAKEELKSLICGESRHQIGIDAATVDMISPAEFVEYYLNEED